MIRGIVRGFASCLCLLSFVLALNVASAAAENVETTAEVTILPGPLMFKDLPKHNILHLKLHRPNSFAAYFVATLPAFKVVDATGSGHGWHVAAGMLKLNGSKDFASEVATLALPTPKDLYADEERSNAARSTGSVTLKAQMQTVAFALRNTGMGTFEVRGAQLMIPSFSEEESAPTVELRLALMSGP